MKLSKAIRLVIAVFRCFKKWKGRLEHYKTEASGLKAHASSLILVRAAQQETFGKLIALMQGGFTYEDAVKHFPTHQRE